MPAENKHWVESDETAQARIEQAQSLKAQAADSGLLFEAFLVSSQATWILEMVEQGVFIDPAEAIFVLMQEAQELQQHQDVKQMLLNKRLDESILQADRGECVSGEEVFVNLKMSLKNRAHKTPAVWQKIEQPKTPKTN